MQEESGRALFTINVWEHVCSGSIIARIGVQRDWVSLVHEVDLVAVLDDLLNVFERLDRLVSPFQYMLPIVMIVVYRL
jgi:hypothetical protein